MDHVHPIKQIKTDNYKTEISTPIDVNAYASRGVAPGEPHANAGKLLMQLARTASTQFINEIK